MGKLATATNYANERVVQSARLEFDGLYRDLFIMAEGRGVAREEPEEHSDRSRKKLRAKVGKAGNSHHPKP